MCQTFYLIKTKLLSPPERHGTVVWYALTVELCLASVMINPLFKNKYKNNYLKLEGEVGMAVLKTRLVGIISTYICSASLRLRLIAFLVRGCDTTTSFIH